MAYAALADFLEELTAGGELARVAAEVDANLEIAEITRRVAAAGGPALLFEHVRGQSMAVVTNLLGSEARICHALEIESLDAITGRIEALIAEHTPHNWFERLKTSGDEAGANKFRAKAVKSGPCQQVVRLGSDVELGALPLITEWPDESLPAITGGLVVSQDRANELSSVSRCPLVALDHNRLAVIDDAQGELARHWANHRQAGEKMELAVILGGDPALAIAASIELPSGVDFYHVAGLLRGRGVDVVKCRTHAHEVPADADLILEGYLDPETPAAVVASGSSGGRHPIERPAPVLHVTAITHRSHPIVPAAIHSPVQGEGAALLKVRERVLLPAIRTLAPGVVDLHLPPLGGLRNYAFVSLTKTHPFQARQVASALWGSSALGSIRFLVLLDADVDVRDIACVLAEIGARVLPERDLFAYDGPAPATSGAEPASQLARHIGIDATTKIADEQRAAPSQRLENLPEIEELVSRRWEEYKLNLSGRTDS